MHPWRTLALRVSLALVIALIPSLPLRAQPLIKTTTPASCFSADRRTTGAVLRMAPVGLQIQATNRDALIVQALLQVPGNSKYELKRLVVRFQNSKNSDASLRSIELKSEYGSRLFFAATGATGDRSVIEQDKVPSIANAWNLPEFRETSALDAKTVVRLEIDSPMNIDPGSGPIPDNYKPPPGAPFVLISVDAYFVNPAFKATIPAGSALILAHPGPDVPANPAPHAPQNIPGSKAVIDMVNHDNQLLWYRHDGREDGTFRWSADKGLIIGTGWNFRAVIGAGHGVIYAITPDGDLLWYRHEGSGDGSFKWALAQGQLVNSGFKGLQVIAASGGVLYTLGRNGELRWYRHDGYADGTDRWTAREGRVIATDWHYEHIFAGDGGVIYAKTGKGELYRFRHDGRGDGTPAWSNPDGQLIASNWQQNLFAFSSGDGVIYTITPESQLLWYRDEGRNDDTVRWADSSGNGKVVGVGWTVRSIFSGSALQP